MIRKTPAPGILCCLALFLSSSVFAQRIDNVKATFVDGKVSISYDLNNYRSGQQFNIEILGSHNGYSDVLKLVTGDVGKNIGGGAGKRIEWNAATELGKFNGEINFKVRGSLIITPFTFTTPVEGGSMRRGKSTTIKWNGGVPTQPVKIEMIQDGNVIQSVTANTTNSGEFSWQVPGDTKKGAYSMKLTAGGEVVRSGAFKVKAKVPLLVKLLPFVAVGVVLAVLPKGGGTEDPKVEADLPNAPTP